MAERELLRVWVTEKGEVMLTFDQDETVARFAVHKASCAVDAEFNRRDTEKALKELMGQRVTPANALPNHLPGDLGRKPR